MSFSEEQLDSFKSKLSDADVEMGHGVEEYLDENFRDRFDTIQANSPEMTSAKVCVNRMCQISIDLAQQAANAGDTPVLTKPLAEEAVEATRYAHNEESEIAGPC